MEKLSQELQQKVDDNFNNFWKDIVCDENGNLDLEKVKRELYDYSLGMERVQEVYYELTRNTGSLHADPQSVIKLAYQQMEGVEVVFVDLKNSANNPLQPVGFGETLARNHEQNNGRL